MAFKYHQGTYKPQNPQKYKGDKDNIIFRSGLELSYMRYFDTNKDILEWSSEERVIGYISPVDGRPHRYFPDFEIVVKTPQGVKRIILEIKPHSQCSPPRQRKNSKSSSYINEIKTFATNQAKWEAASLFAKKNGSSFQVLTEKDL